MLPRSGDRAGSASCVFFLSSVYRQEAPAEPGITLCMDNLSSHGGEGEWGQERQRHGRRPEKVDRDAFAR